MIETNELARRTDLRGRTILITGGSSGIGAATARALALTGANILITGRNLQSGGKVLEELRSMGSGRMELLPLDLADFADVGRFAAAAQAFSPEIDILICNAGVSETPEERLSNGLDVRFATNHLGHFLLAHRLFGALSARGARIVMLSSAAHKGRPLQMDDLGRRRREIAMRLAYGESKTANALFAVEATRRWHGHGIFANAVLPGSIMTGLQRNHSPERIAEMFALGGRGTSDSVFVSVQEGAATSVWAALAPELDRVGGLMLEDCGLCRISGPGIHPWRGYELHATDSETARALWTGSLTLLRELGVEPETELEELKA